MSTIYDGVPANIVIPTSLAIASSNSANPCQITVSGSLPPDFFTGCLVHIFGHTVNTQVNGVWPVTVTGASTFTIPVAGTGSGGATGSVLPLNLTPSFTVPSDGDLANESSIDTFVKRGADRAQFLAARIGQFKLARREIFQLQGISVAPWAIWAGGAVTAGTPVALIGQTAAWGTALGAAVTLPSAGPGNVVFAIDGVALGDYVAVKLVATCEFTNLQAIVLYSTIKPAGFLPSFSDFSAVVGSSAQGSATQNILCEGIVTNFANQAGVVHVQPVLYPLTTSSPILQLQSEALLTIDIWRPTGVNQ